MNITDSITTLKNNLPSGVKLLAVSKYKPVDDILEAYNIGHKVFGESKAQELKEKQAVMPKDIEWHMIGHLQTNKIKYIADFVSLIHTVDSLKLLKAINKEAKKRERTINCLIQMHIATEEDKFGMSFDEIVELIDSSDFAELQNIQITGLMGMATFTKDEEQIKSEFEYLASCFHLLKGKYFNDNAEFKELSMGMSGDYKIAIEAGSTLIRVGSSIFGNRNT